MDQDSQGFAHASLDYVHDVHDCLDDIDNIDSEKFDKKVGTSLVYCLISRKRRYERKVRALKIK